MTVEAGVTRIPVFDLKAQYADLKPELDAAALRVMGSGWFIQGTEHAAFESEFAEYCEAEQAVGVASGTRRGTRIWPVTWKTKSPFWLKPSPRVTSMPRSGRFLKSVSAAMLCR